MSISITQNAGAGGTSVADVVSDCTWSAPPISTTTTGTSGTGSVYVNVPPDYGYLQGPNTAVAGYCQKYIQQFARSNSTYGQNYSKEHRIACKMATNWTGTFTDIIYSLYHRINVFGNQSGVLTDIGFGIEINMTTKALSIRVHNGTSLTSKGTLWVAPTSGICSVDFMVKSDGAGYVSVYADGVFIDQVAGMSTATSTVAKTSTLDVVEIISGGSAGSTAQATAYVSNLRTFVAIG